MTNPEIKKPLETEALAGEVSRGFDESDKLSARLDRYSTAKKRALENYDFTSDLHQQIIKEGEVSRLSELLKLTSNRLGRCGNYLKFHHYYTVGKVRLASARFCKQHLICPLCAIRRGAKTLQAYTERYQAIMTEHPSWRLSMITVTVKNGDNLKERFEHLQQSMQRVFERRRDWLKKGRGLTEWRKVHGYVGTYEVTNQGKGWHPHAHIMVLHTESFNYAALKAEWFDITGDSHVLNVTPAKHPESPEIDFLEVFKYAVKFSDLTPADNVTAFLTLRKHRLLFSGGAFRGVEVPESLEDETLDDLPYVELMYRYTLGQYRLTSSEMREPASSQSLEDEEPDEGEANFCQLLKKASAPASNQEVTKLPLAKELQRNAKKRWLRNLADTAGDEATGRACGEPEQMTQQVPLELSS